MPDIFSVPIFFIVFRETLEAAIIVSVLLGLVEQIVRTDDKKSDAANPASRPENSRRASEKDELSDKAGGDSPQHGSVTRLPASHGADEISAHNALASRQLIRRLRIQIFFGAGLGLLLALCIGAAFIAVWFTQAKDLWSKSESLWEGIFELIASLLIFAMGLTMLKMDRAKAKWRVKLQRAFFAKTTTSSSPAEGSSHAINGSPDSSTTVLASRGARTGKWVLFILPFITVLREGMEAVVFVGGVSLGQSATAIPLAAAVGIICGLVCGWLIYAFASRAALTTFLIVMTNFILLIGAGLFSRAIGAFQSNAFNSLLGADVDDLDSAGNGPGSYDVRGNVWHLNCCNPEHKLDGTGWMLFAALFGWSNNASVGTILAYVGYWGAVIAALVYLKFKEGRTKILGRESAAGARRRMARAER